jgi:hypothetical protein
MSGQATARPNWKPDAAEAQFLGQLLGIDSGLAEIARGQLVKGIPLREVVASFKAASDIARLVRGDLA